jgi:hypothetical protein
MTFKRFPCFALLAFYLLSPQSLLAASHDSDAVPHTTAGQLRPTQQAFLISDEEDEKPNQDAVLIPYEDGPVQTTDIPDKLYPPSTEKLSSSEKNLKKISPNQGEFTSPSQKQLTSKTAPLSEDEDPIIVEFKRKLEETSERAKKAEAKVAQQNRLIELMKLQAEEERKVQQAEALAADQARQIEAMKLNPPKPQPNFHAPQPSLSKAVPSSALIPQASASSVPRPVDIAIPEVARGFEEVYRRFLGGKLIYTDPTSKEKKELPIRSLDNPLEETFDLSGCGDTGKYLSISTGYRKGIKAENATKVEIWITPWFLVNKNLSSTAMHLKPIMGSWDAGKAPLGLFWTWGGWSDLGWYEYLVSVSLDVLGSENLLEKYRKAVHGLVYAPLGTGADRRERAVEGGRSFMFHF